MPRSFRVSSVVLPLTAFLLAGLLALASSAALVRTLEARSEIGVRAALDMNGLTWAEVGADGLQVTLAGTAPTEALRFQALSTAGSVVDAARVIDEMSVAAETGLIAPRFSAEILRNDAGISVFGLVPEDTDLEAVRARFLEIGDDAPLADFLETARHPVPDGWEDALDYALTMLDRLPRAKVSVEAGRVTITALTDSVEAKDALQARLSRRAPAGVRLTLDIRAPRPVLTPFTLRFVHDAEGVRFDACSADTEETRDRIVQAAFSAGLTGAGDCTIGMGVPSPRWADAAELAIAAVDRLGGGSVTFSNADVSLRGLPGTDAAVFDRVVGELDAGLPEVFALTAVLPEPRSSEEAVGTREFLATLSPEGLVQLRGRLPDAVTRELTASFAKSLFGAENVYSAALLDESLPDLWSLRVLSGLEALGLLANGALIIETDLLRVSGTTHVADGGARIAQLLADKLGEAANYEIDVAFVEPPDPADALPTPEECEAKVGEIITARKINFEPGSATIDADTLAVMDEIAEVLKVCGNLRLEIQGHTDSQGRESMNMALSQARAQSVLNELRARRVLTARFEAKGYGETRPIADNGSEEGREANRRIEFRLIQPEIVEQQSTLDSMAGAVQDDAATTDADGAGDDQ